MIPLMGRSVALIHFCCCGMLIGCSQPSRRADFSSVDPSERTLAIGHAARDRDEGSIRSLIALLDSNDPAERMAAIRTLERLTGQTLGYDHAAPESARREAVARWEEWGRAGNAMPPASGTGGH